MARRRCGHTSTLVVAATALLVATLGAGTAAGDDGAGEAAIERVGGSDRYETAARVAAAHGHAGDTVYVASGEGAADALAAGPAAASDDAALLLVRGTGPLPSSTRESLADVSPERIVLVGGTTAVDAGVAGRLAEFADVERLAGADRYATAAEVATATFDTAARAYVATGKGVVDALSGGVLAASRGAPVLLARPDGLPASTRRALTALGTTDVTLIGGEQALGAQVVAELEAHVPGTVERIAGADRFATAAAVSDRLDAAEAVFLTSGRGFADALAAVPAAGRTGASLLLVEPRGALPDSTAQRLAAGGFARRTVVGGEAAVADGVVDLLHRAAAGEPTCIDLNTADAGLLTEIRGVGEVRAGDIVEGRPWGAVHELTEVHGIGPATLEGILDQGLARVDCP